MNFIKKLKEVIAKSRYRAQKGSFLNRTQGR